MKSYPPTSEIQNWSSAPDTLECLWTLGAPSEPSSAQQAPAYDALVARTNLCSAPDTLERSGLQTPRASRQAPNKRPPTEAKYVPKMPDLSSGAAGYWATYPVIARRSADVPLCSPSIGETAYGSRPTGTHQPVAAQYVKYTLPSIFPDNTHSLLPPQRDEAASTEASPGARRASTDLCRGRMQIEAQIAEHMQFRMYRERRGKIYLNYRRDMRDGSLQGKIGWTSNMKRRRASYQRCESTIQQIVWVAEWECRHPKRVERIAHLTLCSMGAALEPTECLGSRCSIHHREYYDFKQAGGVNGYIQVVENTLRDLGEPVKRLML
ncbi:hypothetical protein B0H14DRAFT_2556087 [Mycena olivaceomarginata]|nr:hypothetical protein B0H14DRAFT_2556087 [Mycena olivaceomarginata]